MKAVRIRPPTSPGTPSYSASNPAPTSSLSLDDVPAPPEPSAGQVLVRTRAATVTRDELAWPETYAPGKPILGHDVAGVITAVGPATTAFRVGDEVFGMLDGGRGGAWAQLVAAPAHELALRPRALTWEACVTVPMSGLTAWQALFEKAGAPEPDVDRWAATKTAVDGTHQKTLLVTGASGAVGAYIVQLGALADLYVVAASSSTARNGEFLRKLGAAEVVEYGETSTNQRKYDFVIDTVGGEPLLQCWQLVKDHSPLVSVDSSSFSFVERRPPGKESVKAIFFVVQPSGQQLARLARALELGLLKTFVADAFSIADIRKAYEVGNGRTVRRGKVVLTL